MAVSIAYLRAVASGDAAGEVALAAQLGALLMSDRTRAIEMAEAIVAAAELTPKTSTK